MFWKVSILSKALKANQLHSATATRVATATQVALSIIVVVSLHHCSIIDDSYRIRGRIPKQESLLRAIAALFNKKNDSTEGFCCHTRKKIVGLSFTD